MFSGKVCSSWSFAVLSLQDRKRAVSSLLTIPVEAMDG